MTGPGVKWVRKAEELNNAWILETFHGGRSPMQQIGALLKEIHTRRAMMAWVRDKLVKLERLAKGWEYAPALRDLIHALDEDHPKLSLWYANTNEMHCPSKEDR